jgi:raffinose/stachyose/melibiose transport system permease protein
VLYIAGLQQIDRNLFEAAKIDGASSWQMFWRITLPLLKPTVKLSVFFAILGSLQFFDMVMSMTKGGPFDATQTMVSFLYNYGVTRMQIGFGSAVGVVVFIICVAFAFGYKRWLMKDEH